MAKSAAVKPPKKPLKSRLWNQRYLFLLRLLSGLYLYAMLQ